MCFKDLPPNTPQPHHVTEYCDHTFLLTFPIHETVNTITYKLKIKEKNT